MGGVNNDGGGGGYTQKGSRQYGNVDLINGKVEGFDTYPHAGGGGYGTMGTQFGASSSDAGYLGGRTYGNIQLKTLYLGSGGGSCKPKDGPAGVGGNGGGALWLRCDGVITMRKNSRISSNGDIARSYESGCGSGGSIYILMVNYECLKQHETAMIEAIGGYKGRGNSNGGNGRIRVEIMSKEAKKLKDTAVDMTGYNFIPRAFVKWEIRLGTKVKPRSLI